MIITEFVIKYGKKVPVSELPPSSRFKVEVRCPSCRSTRTVHYSSVIMAGHTSCQKCCVRKSTTKPLEIGKVYGRLTCLESSFHSKISKLICSCGKVVETESKYVRRGEVQSCGCLREENYFHVQRKGSEHHNWKGGVSGDRPRFMQTSVYKNWRTSVFERDDYLCTICAYQGSGLVAHHLEPYHSNKDLRTCLDNGVTLCTPCHTSFHSIYGKIHFNTENFREFHSAKVTV